MPIQVSYMGTKRQIAPKVAAIIEQGPPGPLLDVFSGVCAIGCAVGPTRQIWCNDIELFAATTARAFFSSPDPPLNFDFVADIAKATYLKNRRDLEDRFSELVSRERAALTSPSLTRLEYLKNDLWDEHCVKHEEDRQHLAQEPNEFPYRLLSITFAGGYIGLVQALQADSIRYAIDELRKTTGLNVSQHQWLALALCQAIGKIATTTGHFAQYSTVKTKTLGRFVAQRKRSVWFEWLRAVHEFAPIGNRRWRRKNRIFQEETTHLLERLSWLKTRPGIVYADPPYTSDHYSRYYHLYDTLLKYDYPDAIGIGRYRSDRFISDFSIKTKILAAMNRLISNTAKLGARLVLSYPEVGLLETPEETIRSLVKTHFGYSPHVTRIPHSHSSLGASKGHQAYSVNELVFATR